MGPLGGALANKISALIKDTPESSLFLPALGGHSERWPAADGALQTESASTRV